MFARPWFVIRYWLCWVLFFEGARLVFLLANYREFKSAGFGLSLQSMWFGLRMDFSAAAYIAIPISLLVLLSVYIKFFRQPTVYTLYTGLVLFMVQLVLFADIGLYQAWGTRVDATPLKYLSNPKEVWASIYHLPIACILLGFTVMFVVLLVTSGKLVKRYGQGFETGGNKLGSLATLILLIAAFIIPIRGGFQLAPLNHSSVYFSQNNFANLAALNAPWNFLRSLSRRSGTSSNPFVVDDISRARAIADSLLRTGGSHVQVITPQNSIPPNLLLIVWESFTSKAIGLQVQGKMVTPGFNQLVKEGIYFSEMYATGDRTDKGIVGILSGYPAQPTTSIIKEPVKAAKLPMLSKVFKDKGYSTSFYYGGELEFANMKAYLLQGQFDAFTTINDFSSKDQNSKWGAHDGVVADKLQNELKHKTQPFFTTWLTLSSHEPYEIPAKPLLHAKDDVSKFLNSMHYTDSILYAFIQQAKQQAWWKNTLVVIVADHGHRLPRAQHKPDDFKIPLLFLGGVVKEPYKTISSIGSQTDLPTTLLSQLNLPSKEFSWSRNLMDSTRNPWAFFTFNNGFGFLKPGFTVVYDNVGRLVMEQRGSITEKDIYNGRVLQQVAFQDFLDK